MTEHSAMSSISVSYAGTTRSARSNELGMRPMQERTWEKRGEQYLLIKSPPASGKSRALMFVALDKLANQGLRQAIVVVPERTIGASFNDEPLSTFGFWADWTVRPKWNLCNAPGAEGGKVNAVKTFLESDDRILVCTHATFRFAIERFGADAFDDRLIAVDEFHHVSANPDNRLGDHVGHPAPLRPREGRARKARAGSRGRSREALVPGRMGEPTNHEAEALRALSALWDAIAAKARENPMRFSVVASRLVEWPPRQYEMFKRTGADVQGALDTVRKRFGARAVTLGESADRKGKYTGLKISFEHIPDIVDFEWLGIDVPQIDAGGTA